MSFNHLSRGGSYYRVAESSWVDPLDGHLGLATGGRWNRPDSFPVMYLNRTKSVARKFVAHKLHDQPYSPEDLDPSTGPILVTVDLDTETYVDVITNNGCVAAALPKSYPTDSADRSIAHTVCWPIGQGAWDEGRLGIACRSANEAAAAGDEELAWFQRGDRLTGSDTESFARWFFDAE